MGHNVREQLLALRLMTMMDAGPRMSFLDPRSRLPVLTVARVTPPQRSSATPITIRVAEALLNVQERTGVGLSLPEQVPWEGANSVLLTSEDVTNGMRTVSWDQIVLHIEREYAERLLHLFADREPHGLRHLSTDERDLFGTKVDLGENVVMLSSCRIAEEEYSELQSALADTTRTIFDVTLERADDQEAILIWTRFAPTDLLADHPGDATPSGPQSE
jgi:hypothetical protein